MPDLVTKQIHYEKESWKHLVYYMMDENAQLKTRLGEVLKFRSNSRLVEYVEKYQNEFIHIDGLLSILRNHLADLEKMLEHVSKIDENQHELVRRLEIIRNIIVNTEQQFINSRNEFNRSVIILLDQLKTPMLLR